MPDWTWRWAWHWTWRWAWNGILGWAGIGSIEGDLTGRARLGVVLGVLGPALRRDWVRPLRDRLFRRLPVKVLLLRLVPAGHGWYRVPDRGTALHAFFRLGVICQQGDYLRVLGGKLVAIGLVDQDNQRCEFWLTGEIDQPDPPPAVKLAGHP